MASGHVAVVGADDLDAQVNGMCEKLAGHAPLTIRAPKEALKRLALDREAQGDDLIRAVYGGTDFRKGVDAFTAKRRPMWRGR